MSKPLHIIMLLDNPFESDARVEKEIESLYKRGHTITLYATKENTKLKALEERSNVRVIRLFEHIIHQPLNKVYRNKIREYAKQICTTEFDIIHCHDYKTLIIGKAIKEIKKETKIIYDSHEFLSGWPWYKEIQTLKGKIKGRLVWKKFKKLEKEAIPFCNSILTVSETLSIEMKKQFKLSDQPKVVKNIPEAITIEPNTYFRDLYQLNEKSTIIIHSGNIYHSKKRIKNLLSVFKALQKENVHLVFIGDSEKLKSISEHTKEENIHFHHYPNRKELYSIIQSADFGLVYTWQPNWKSHWFSLPNRILEYTLAQLPIISTSQPEFIKISQKYNHLILFNGNSKEELTNAIISAKEKRDVLKSNAIIASLDLSWEKEIETLVEIYKENSHA